MSIRPPDPMFDTPRERDEDDACPAKPMDAIRSIHASARRTEKALFGDPMRQDGAIPILLNLKREFLEHVNDCHNKRQVLEAKMEAERVAMRKEIARRTAWMRRVGIGGVLAALAAFGKGVAAFWATKP